MRIAKADGSNTKTRRRKRAPSFVRFGGFAISAILILSGLLVAVQTNQSTWAWKSEDQNGKIVFTKGSVQDPDSDEIYVMDADDGSDQTQLTR
jgi:hypothetical protein